MDDTEDQYKKILDNISDGIYFVDPDRRIIYWNGGAEKITGFTASQVIGRRCMDNILNHVTENGVQLCQKGCPLHATLTDGKKREAEIYLHHADGHRIPILVRTSPIRDKEGKITGAVETFSDNTPLLKTRRMVDKLQKTVLVDPVTGVGNRRHATDKIQRTLLEYQNNLIPTGVLFIDIDHFKSVNDTYGHDTGDRMLRIVAATLKYNLRVEDTISRWGGEEFLVMLEGVNRQGLLTIAEKMRNLVESSFLTIGGKSIHVTVSIGATMMRLEDDLKSLLDRVDQAMYKSKKDGRNRVTMKTH
jgi:diguanylate cyclase (GGDEF)-like protein/PAS domain S-box-containing protein